MWVFWSTDRSSYFKGALKNKFLEFYNTTSNNLKFGENPWKICVKKVIFSKAAGLQVYSLQLS